MTPFERDRFTWLAYLMLGYFAYLLGSLGPLVPFLRSELNLNYTVAGFHLSAFAIGMTLTGILGDRLARRFGRYMLFWLGGAGMGLGAIFLTLGRSESITISASFIMGFVGTWLLIMIQATLSDRHGENRAIALTESNVLASATSAFAPFLIGTLERIGLGWRSALTMASLVWVGLFMMLRQEQMPATTNSATFSRHGQKLPPAFWAYWILVLFVVSVEWCVVFWSADFLVQVIKMPPVDASTAVSVYFLANVIGRMASSRFARRWSTQSVLLAALLVSSFGFPIFWLSNVAVFNVGGLFITGIGVGSLFPLTLSAASRVGVVNSNAASARVSLASGLAILVTPQLLATIADSLGIKQAYAVVSFLLVIALFVNYIAGKIADSTIAPAER